MKKIFLLGSIILLSACYSNMDEARLDFAHRAYANKDYVRAMRLLAYPAQKGDPEAQYVIGYMYFYGQGVVEDKDLAIRWFKAAAAHGHIGAQKALQLIPKKS